MKSVKNNSPVFTEEQYLYLDKLYPEKVAAPGVPYDELLYQAGCRLVVEKVKSLVNQMQKRELR